VINTGAVVSGLVIAGLLLARTFDWLRMNPCTIGVFVTFSQIPARSARTLSERRIRHQ
jgi:hypothetical protein